MGILMARALFMYKKNDGSISSIANIVIKGKLLK